MSTFAVTIETIRATAPIPDADRVEVASLLGMDFSFVVGKGQFQPGDRVLYFPVDSLLPAELISTLGLTGRLAGAAQNRVKTLRLRGQISQGVVAAVSLIPEGLTDPAEITATLGVTKYEPPEEVVNDAILTRLPEGQSKYDIESADRYVEVASALLDQPVFITEKVEGSNLWVRAEPGGAVSVGQREHSLLPKVGVDHTFHAMARRHRLVEFAAALAERAGQPAVVYGEALGPKIQGNIYNLKSHTPRLFDVRVGFDWLAPQAFLAAVQDFFGDLGLVVPILQAPDGTTLRTWLAGRSIKEASDGRSLLADRNREGIVIKPLVESRDRHLGRLILKQRSPLYLAKSEL